MKLPNRCWWWPVGLMVAITLVSGTATPAVPGDPFIGRDKLAHFAVFGVLATAWIRCRPRSVSSTRPRLPWALAAVGLTASFGLADELHQTLTPLRTFEWADFVADCAGGATAVALYNRIPMWRNALERRVWRSRLKPSQEPTA